MDGEWRDLKIRREKILVKDHEAIDFEIQYTHRGPIYDFENLQFNAGILFGGKVASIANPPKYSLRWANMVPGETSVKLLKSLFEVKTVP